MFKFILEGIAIPSDEIVYRLFAEKGIEVTENLEKVADQFFELRDSDEKKVVFVGTKKEIEIFKKTVLGRSTLFICKQKEIEYKFQVVR